MTEQRSAIDACGLNVELARGRPIIVTFLPRTDALADPGVIRTDMTLIPEHVDPIMPIELVER